MAFFQVSDELLCEVLGGNSLELTSKEDLKRALCMPSTSQIVSLSGVDRWGFVEVCARDSDLPEADVPHRLDPILTRMDIGTEHEWVRWDWNVKP